MARSKLRRFRFATALGTVLILVGTASGSEASSATFTPTQDAQVRSDYPSTNYGSSTRLAVDGSPQVMTAMRFAVANLSGTITSAKLRVFVHDPSTNAPSVYRATGSWTESTVTWNTKPAISGGMLDDLDAVASGTWVEYDVTGGVTGNGTYDFALSGSYGDGVTYGSRESAERPQLVIDTSTSSTSATTVDVTLQPQSGISGTQRVNFAVPLPRAMLWDPDLVRVLASGVELPAARRELALYPDGSLRSVQLQVSTTVASGKVLQVRINEAPTTAPLSLVAVSTTLDPSDGTMGPRVWARLPASWLAASGVVGPIVTEAAVSGTALDAWDTVCDYQNHTVDQFLSLQTSKDVWLYDRGTTMYRGYARRGDQVTLESAYRETAIYRARLSGTDASTTIGVPSSSSDLKYHYTQNMAIHYLLTGDDRFREGAEDVAAKIATLWTSPGYAGGSDFWTERHAGFALLGYVWARIVTDDQAAVLDDLADDAVDAYLAMQATYPTTWTDASHRCFAHTAAAHGENYGTWGCSPWMSAILADGLDQYATERGGTRATQARAAIVKLGAILARDGRDSSGKPYYWMGIGSASDEIDPYDEHWGEPAYVVAMAWHHGGRTDASLKTAAMAMLAGLKSYGESPHMRSFNWQCRSAVAAPYFLK
ncbi:MAG TPA: DNRLRE domain-containing protein [Kofleriaceae bacterium]|nr:DNRLRE domain-containing protein [Kofleriaceae bacterium]